MQNFFTHKGMYIRAFHEAIKKYKLARMKFAQIVLLNICCFYITACANKPSPPDEVLVHPDTTTLQTLSFAPGSFPIKKIIENVVCRNDATQSYTLYIPSAKPMRLFIFSIRMQLVHCLWKNIKRLRMLMILC